jgi:hypothetical protein
VTDWNIHVGRRSELDGIRELAKDPAAACRLALVVGVEKIGKTSLLSKAFEQHRTRPVAYLDLKKAREPYQVLEWIVDRLGKHVTFNNYHRRQTEQKLREPTLKTGDINVANHSSFTLINDGDRFRHQLASVSANQLIEDLRGAISSRLLLLFDHYNHCPVTLQDWLSQRLMPALIKVVDSLVLLASQDLPWGDEPPLSWLGGNPDLNPRIVELQPLSVEDVKEWMVALNIDPAAAEFAMRITGGMPAAISAQFAAYFARDGIGAS